MSVAKFVHAAAAALGVLFASHAAQAADLYGGYKDEPVYVPVLPWQGFYIGGYLGGGWDSLEPASNVVLLGGGGSIPVGTINNSGFLGGVQLGYNIQAGNFVYGVEADFGGMDAGGSGSFADPTTPARILDIKGGGGFYGDITGRAGFALGNALIYAKGGFAYFTGNIRVVDAYDDIRQDSGTFTGWTVGGGVEYLIAPRWTVKAEYQYFDFDNNNFSCCTGAAEGRIENSLTSNTVKIGFNYLLHSLRSPLY
jgi:outer membrane immunogenic protein